MAELISAAEMEAIREVPLSGMQTPVSILRLESVEVPDGDDQLAWVETETTVGWIYEPLDYPHGTATGGVQAIVHEFRIYLPIWIDVVVGDQIGLTGDIFTVTNTNAADTYRPMTRATLVRAE